MVTHNEVISMKPGKEMDELIATEVMGWKKAFDSLEDKGFWCDKDFDGDTDTLSFDYYVDEWKPSTDRYVVLDVIDQIGKENKKANLVRINHHNGQWHCHVSFGPKFGEAHLKKTLAEAVCTAALLAVTP